MPRPRKPVSELQGHRTRAEIEARRQEEAAAARASAAPGIPERPTGLDRQSRRYFQGFVDKLSGVLRLNDGERIMEYVRARREKRNDDANAIESEFLARVPETPVVEPAETPAPVNSTDVPLTAPKALETAKQYCREILDGTILSGKLAKLAVMRFVDMLQKAEGGACGYTFNDEAAQRPVDFLTRLGLALLPWQVFFISACFGFLKSDGTRLVNTLYCEVARKNGKTTMLAGLGCYLASPREIKGDGEPSPDIFCAATNRFQSSELVFREAKKLRERDTALRGCSIAYKTSIVWPNSHGSFTPTAANSEHLAGLNVHGGIVDEYADNKSANLWNIFQTGTVARKQPMMCAITTAGCVREGNPAWETRQHGIQVLEGHIDDPSMFIFVCALDEGDDMFDERNWIRSNPSLGVLVYVEKLRELAERARTIESSLPAFQRFHLNVWPTSSAKSWIRVEDLYKPGVAYINESEKNFSPVERIERATARLRGRICFAGLDLAETNDLSCLALVFPPPATEPNGIYEVIFKVFCPESDIAERSKRDRVPYQQWSNGKNPLLIATPGEVTDYAFIRQSVMDAIKVSGFRVQELGYDKHFASDIVQRLEEKGIKTTAVPQAFELSSTIARTEGLIKAGKICLHQNPIATWSFSNCVLTYGAKGDARLAKEKSRERIDCAVAFLCAAYRMFLAPPPRTRGRVEFW